MRAWIAVAMMLALSVPSLAQDAQQSSVWDLKLGTGAGDIGGNFIDYACGSNGGPPLTQLRGFADYATCPAEESGLHEVYFRYNDEQEYIARALEQTDMIALYRGTKVYDFPVVASALFDDAGILAGIRLVTDPRDVEIRPRNQHWALGNVLRNRFGAESWTCADLPAETGETAVGSYFIKSNCEKSSDGAHLLVQQRYLHKHGQTYRDAHTGQVQAGVFESWTRFEMIAGTQP